MRNVEDIKICKSVTDRQYNGQYICDSQNKKEKRTNIIYKTLHRKLKIEQPESHKKNRCSGWISSSSSASGTRRE